MDYNVWFAIGDSSVSLYLLIPQYGYLASLTCFYWFWHMLIPVFWSNFTPVSFHMLKCSCAHTLSCPFMCSSFASIGHADIMLSVVSSNCWQVCTCYLSLCSIFLSHNILFVTTGFVLPLHHFQFMLLGLPSVARSYYYYYVRNLRIYFQASLYIIIL